MATRLILRWSSGAIVHRPVYYCTTDPPLGGTMLSVRLLSPSGVGNDQLGSSPEEGDRRALRRAEDAGLLVKEIHRGQLGEVICALPGHRVSGGAATRVRRRVDRFTRTPRPPAARSASPERPRWRTPSRRRSSDRLGRSGGATRPGSGSCDARGYRGPDRPPSRSSVRHWRRSGQLPRSAVRPAGHGSPVERVATLGGRFADRMQPKSPTAPGTGRAHDRAPDLLR